MHNIHRAGVVNIINHDSTNVEAICKHDHEKSNVPTPQRCNMNVNNRVEPPVISLTLYVGTLKVSTISFLTKKIKIYYSTMT